MPSWHVFCSTMLAATDSFKFLKSHRGILSNCISLELPRPRKLLISQIEVELCPIRPPLKSRKLVGKFEVLGTNASTSGALVTPIDLY